MGVCASCLGRRRSDSIDEDDVSRLLFDDPNGLHYGSFSDHNLSSQGDPLESQREVEALQRVVARTANNLVDVFEITPEASQRIQPAIFPGQEARLARYQHILSKLSSGDARTTAHGNQGAAAWFLGETDSADQPEQTIMIKEGSSGPLVGTFADAVAAI
ncbi:late endosomal/lysosomal adaptor and MAPK and MTOR activator-domain-containing protein [Nemania sp. NC0429]|nr:late endosomal/lysosomal adaptor and MAPK and MTOR activator-domain-containing protein [Nemania sp. NC0429]